MKTDLLSIDAWRDADGWTWNQWYTVEKDIIMPGDITPRALLRFARDNLGVLTENSKGKVYIEDDGYNLVICARGTREPLFAFCYGMHDQ